MDELRAKHGFVGLSCDRDWSETKLFEQLKKLALLSREGKLDRFNMKGLNLAFIESAPTNVFMSSLALNLCPEDSGEEWLHSLSLIDFNSLSLSVSKTRESVIKLKKSVSGRERNIASLLRIASFSCDLVYEGTSMYVKTPDCLAKLCAAERHLQIFGDKHKGKFKDVSIRIARYTFLKKQGDDENEERVSTSVQQAGYFISSGGDLVLPSDCGVIQLCEALEKGGVEAAKWKKTISEVEKSRLYVERTLDLSSLRADEEWFGRERDNGNKLIRAYTELAKHAVELSKSSLHNFELIVGDRYAVGVDGSLIIRWDFTYERLREFLIST